MLQGMALQISSQILMLVIGDKSIALIIINYNFKIIIINYQLHTTPIFCIQNIIYLKALLIKRDSTKIGIIGFNKKVIFKLFRLLENLSLMMSNNFSKDESNWLGENRKSHKFLQYKITAIIWLISLPRQTLVSLLIFSHQTNNHVITIEHSLIRNTW